MKREYTVSEFRTVVDTLNELVPGMQIATDIICGFPGTPAARMKKVPSTIVKKRSRELTCIFESFNPYQGMEGRIERIWITEIATDVIHLVGHAKGYVLVLVMGPESLLGISTDVKITSVGIWSVFGEVVGNLEALKEDVSPMNSLEKAYLDSNSCSDCAFSREEAESCSHISQNCCMGNEASDSIIVDSLKPGNSRGGILANSMPSLVPGKRTQGSEEKREHEMQNMNASMWAILDWILVGGYLRYE